MKKLYVLLLMVSITSIVMIAQDDPYIWLEEIEGEKALEFAKEHSDKTYDKISDQPGYEAMYEKCLAIYDSEEKIAYPQVYGDYVYNFWKDENHPRGVWRRCMAKSYQGGVPDWEILIDIDQLSEEDNEKWVFNGAEGLYPSYNRFFVYLSKGGKDASIMREYDAERKQFIEDGFFLDESKGGALYIDKNTLLVASDFGEGSLSESGYPNQVKLWKRGSQLEEAKMLFQGEMNDMGCWPYVLYDEEKIYPMVFRLISFYDRERFVLQEGQLIKLQIPNDSEIKTLVNDKLIVHLKSDWIVEENVYKQGALVSLDFETLLKGKMIINFITGGTTKSSIENVAATKDKLLINKLNNVRNELHMYWFKDDLWESKKVDAPNTGAISIRGISPLTDNFYFDYRDFLTPTTLFYSDTKIDEIRKVKSLPSYFEEKNFEIHQYHAVSKDGTKVPYFVVSPKDLMLDGKAPTIISGYGGFEISEKPFYSGVVGSAWLEKGGVYVLANIRGGGEFGPAWHQDGMREKKQNSFDDFHAIAKDVIKRKISSKGHIGIIGGSNGGLLVGAAFTQRPELYNAVFCAVPLLDMKRYNKLLAGASWDGEYGNPDIPEEWAYIKKYSPYHNLESDATYPEVFFFTSTRDDRVHPGHARKMVAKMEGMGYSVYYYENTEGGHAGSSTNHQRAQQNAMAYAYMLMKLK